MHMVARVYAQTIQAKEFAAFASTFVRWKTFGLTAACGRCEEGDLHKRVIVDRAHFSIREKLKILTGVASGIAYLHSRPIVHRDLSSRNLLMTSSGHVKICDFGCARLMKEFCYRPSFISGSPPWMAPEQILGKPITLTVDVYAFGAILWELFTGKVPFQNRLNTNGVEALQNTCRSERGLPPMSDMQLGNLDPELKSSLHRLLAVSHHANPVLRPDAQRVRQIMLSISDTYDRPPRSEFDEKQHSKVLQEVEFRAELGKRISMFERKYAPGVVKNLENLHKLIETHALNLDAYNETLRNRHMADLNSLPGLKPLINPFAKTNQSHKPDDGTSRRLLSGSRRPPLPTEDQEPMLQKQTLKALRSANPSSSSASSGDTATFNGHNGHNDNMEPAAARYVNIMDPVTSKIVAWQEFKDAASGGTYYYNTMTQGTQWKPPPGWPTVDPQFAGKGKTTGEARSILMADTSPSLRSAQSPFIGPSNPTKLMADTSPSLRSAQSPFVGPSNPTKLMADTSPSLRSAQSPFFGPSNPTKEAESVPKQSPSLGIDFA
jgi:serine/threonine protein kinase